MKTLRVRPDNNFMQTAKWEEIYVLGGHWQNELAFFRDELSFLDILVGRYLVWITTRENYNKAIKVSSSIASLSKTQKQLSEKVANHLKETAGRIRHASEENDAVLRDAHVALEEELTQLTKEFKALKKDVFMITEQIIEDEKEQNSLKS